MTDRLSGLTGSRNECGVPMKMITALPEASWWVVWGTWGKGSEQGGASRGVLGACVERLLAGSILERLTA